MRFDVVGYCPHARENENIEVDLEETGWFFARVDAGQHVVVWVEFGSVRDVYWTSFDAIMSNAALHYGMSLDQVARATYEGVEIADFVTSDVTVAKQHLREDVRAVTEAMHANWETHQLAYLLIASRLCGSFKVPKSKARPIL